MVLAQTCYSGSDTSSGRYKVSFIVNATGEQLVRGFDSEYLARKFVNKLKHSKSCTLASYPIFK